MHSACRTATTAMDMKHNIQTHSHMRSHRAGHAQISSQRHSHRDSAIVLFVDNVTEPATDKVMDTALAITTDMDSTAATGAAFHAVYCGVHFSSLGHRQVIRLS